MKLTKCRLHKIFLKENQTRKLIKNKNKKLLTHNNTYKKRKHFNLRNNTIKNWNTIAKDKYRDKEKDKEKVKDKK